MTVRLIANFLRKGWYVMRWEAKREEKRRMEKLYNETNALYARGCYRNDQGMFVRWYPYSTNHDNNKKWWRRYSNRKFRRGKSRQEDVLNRAFHKRQFDLWWTLY